MTPLREVDLTQATRIVGWRHRLDDLSTSHERPPVGPSESRNEKPQQRS